MIKSMYECEKDAILRVADSMVAAAKTAPKGSGKDKVVAIVIIGDEKEALANTMEELAVEYDEAFIKRDAGNVRSCEAVVVIGVKEEPFGLDNCHMCGFKNCTEMKKAGTNCVFNITDLGIAIGSAVSIAADNRIDNRVMYSIGKAAIKLAYFSSNVKVCYGIPLYTGSKSIFFDRNPGAVLK